MKLCQLPMKRHVEFLLVFNKSVNGKKKKHGTIVSTEDAGQGRMCATNSLIVFTFLDGLEASPPETQQGVVISATSGLLFHISQLGGNQIRSDEPRSTHKPV